MSKKKKKSNNTPKATFSKQAFDYIAYTDGGCEFNPGGRGGAASIILEGDNVVTRVQEGFVSTTNNRMEVIAILNVLKNVPKGSRVLIHSDSQYAINCAAGIWGRNKNTDLWQEYDKLRKGLHISYEWVRGHNGNKYNEECDSMATEAMNNDELLTDSGYAKDYYSQGKFERYDKPVSEFARKYPGGATGYILNIPDGIPETIVAPEKKCNPACVDGISKINSSGASFKSLMQLKTFGLDGWSRTGESDIKSIVPKGTFDYVSSIFDDAKNVYSALRWHCRGLKLEYAIRKELVSIEVSANMYR